MVIPPRRRVWVACVCLLALFAAVPAALAGDRRPTIVVHGIAEDPDSASVDKMVAYGSLVWGSSESGQFGRADMGDDAGIAGTYLNGDALIADVEGMLAPGADWAEWRDQGGVNILAYSKGGLDARYAYAKAFGQGKRIFNRVAMIATPNGGSNFANWLCRYADTDVVDPAGVALWFIPVAGPTIAGRRAAALIALRDFIQGKWGHCRNADDALFTLRTDFARGFNLDVHYPRKAGNGVVAGTRSAGILSALGLPIPGWLSSWTLGTPNDGIVSKSSAFTGKGNPNWIRPLGPLFPYNHLDMPKSRCVVTRAVHDIYRRQTDRAFDPWRDKDTLTPQTLAQRFGECQDIGVLDVPEVPEPIADEYVAAGTDVGIASAQQPVTLTVDPEGADTAVVQLMSDRQPNYWQMSIVPGQPGTLEREASSPYEGFDVHTLILRDLGGQPTSISVTPQESAGDFALSADLYVEANPVWLETTAVAPTGSGTQATVTARLHGVPGSAAGAYTGGALLEGDESADVVEMSEGSSGGDLTFTAALPVTPGRLTPYAVRVIGPHPRMGEGSIQAPSNDGSIGSVTSASAVDTGGDAKPDVLRLRLPITASVAGEHLLGGRLVDSQGTVAAAITAFPTLTVGTQTVDVDVPLAEALRVTDLAPLSVRDLRLTRLEASGEDILVAERTDAGSTGSWLVTPLQPSEPAVRATSAGGVSVDADSAAEFVSFPLKLWLPHSGEWRVSADLTDPTGGFVQERAVAMTVAQAGSPEGREVDVLSVDASGVAEATIRIDGNALQHAGEGDYTLDTLYITNAADASETYEVVIGEAYEAAAASAYGAAPSPTLQVTSAPAAPPASREDGTATFSLSHDGANELVCRVDGGAWSRCTSRTQHVLADMASGEHTFEVSARNATGEQTASRTWWSGPPGPFPMSAGTLAVEAEDTTALDRSGVAWAPTSTPSGSTNGAMVVANQNASWGNRDLVPMTAPELRFPVDFPSAGTYHVWVRAHPLDSGSDSIHVGLDGVIPLTGDALGAPSTGAWTWMSGSAGGPDPATLSVPSAGVHMVSLFAREDGLAVDRVVISQSATPPSGAGPAAATHTVPLSDTTGPAIEARYPASASSGVAVDSNIHVRFSESVDPASVSATSVALTAQGGAAVTATRTLSGSGTTLVIDPAAALTAGATYTVTLGSGITDLGGRALQGAPVAWSFTTDQPPPTSAYVEQGGLVAMEAEAVERIDRTGMGWRAYGAPAGAVSGAVTVPDLNSSWGDPATAPTTAPELRFQVAFSQAGTYKAYVRAYPLDSASDSLHLGLGGSVPASSDSISTGTHAAWNWMSASSGGPSPATITIPSPGTYSVNLLAREDGLAVDRVVLTLSGSAPTGTGPAASVRQ